MYIYEGDMKSSNHLHKYISLWFIALEPQIINFLSVFNQTCSDTFHLVSVKAFNAFLRVGTIRWAHVSRAKLFNETAISIDLPYCIRSYLLGQIRITVCYISTIKHQLLTFTWHYTNHVYFKENLLFFALIAAINYIRNRHTKSMWAFTFGVSPGKTPLRTPAVFPNPGEHALDQPAACHQLLLGKFLHF